MEIEKRQRGEKGRKLWNIVRKGLMPLHLHILLNRAKLATKHLAGNLPPRHRRYYAALTCRSHDITAAFISPRDYEFSCSNSPALRNRHYIGVAAAEEDDGVGEQVDKDAEEFIRKFYVELKKQRKVAALESPSPLYLWATS